MIEAKNITKSFGPVKAVDNLSFTIGKGEVVGFLGPNGAGKTTTMRVLTGFLLPDSGSVKICGLDLLSDDLTDFKRNIGYMPENNPLYKEMLVSEFLTYCYQIHGLAAADRKKAFDRVVAATGIGDVFYKPIKELSKGYKQRVGLAAALLHQPSVLILDEPTEGLDPNQRTDLRHLVKGLSSQCTVLMSTHVMQEAEAICERLLIINNGRLIADSNPEKLAKEISANQTFSLLMEGKDIEKHLSGLSGIESIDVSEDGQGRLRVIVTARPEIKLQSELSKIILKKKWTIWELKEEKQQLEDIFAKLTKKDR